MSEKNAIPVKGEKFQWHTGAVVTVVRVDGSMTVLVTPAGTLVNVPTGTLMNMPRDNNQQMATEILKGRG